MSGDSSRKRFALSHGLLLGAGYAVVGYASLILRDQIDKRVIGLSPTEYAFEFALVVLGGMLIGAICAPLVSRLVRSKPLAPVVLWLSLILAPVVPACMLWGTTLDFVPMLFVEVGIPTGIGISTAYALRLLLHDVAVRGYCTNCSYNLTGLPEPRCPECGTEFER